MQTWNQNLSTFAARAFTITPIIICLLTLDGAVLSTSVSEKIQRNKYRPAGINGRLSDVELVVEPLGPVRVLTIQHPDHYRVRIFILIDTPQQRNRKWFYMY